MFDGAIQLWKGNWERAIRSFKVAAIENNSSSVLFVNLAAAYWRLGETDKAIRALKRAIFLDPVNENAVRFFADVMHLENTPELSLPYLVYILR